MKVMQQQADGLRIFSYWWDSGVSVVMGVSTNGPLTGAFIVWVHRLPEHAVAPP